MIALNSIKPDNDVNEKTRVSDTRVPGSCVGGQATHSFSPHTHAEPSVQVKATDDCTKCSALDAWHFSNRQVPTIVMRGESCIAKFADFFDALDAHRAWPFKPGSLFLRVVDGVCLARVPGTCECPRESNTPLMNTRSYVPRDFGA